LFSLNISSEAKKIVDEIQSEIANRYSEGGITCLSVINLVCGTDNKTYNNICEAKKVGVDVSYEGECGSCIAQGKTLIEGKACCPGYVSCLTGTKNTCQKSCDTSGDVVCTADWTPVCGDNGKTYSNICFLNQAGIVLNHKGECNGNEVKIGTKVETEEAPEETETVKIANPASAFCVKQGYTLEIRNDAEGNQYGVCIFTDGKECDEWKFFRLECGKEYVK
jgi:putative hemolysin